MEKENKNKEMENGVVYEIGYILLPSLALEQVPAKVATLTKYIEKAGGVVISGENPVLIDLEYPMLKVVGTTRHKCDSGYFGWVKFETSSEGIEGIKKSFDGNEFVLRYLLIKTVRENTLLHGKMSFKKESERVGDDSDSELEVEGEILDESKPESSPEEIDKT